MQSALSRMLLAEGRHTSDDSRIEVPQEPHAGEAVLDPTLGFVRRINA